MTSLRRRMTEDMQARSLSPQTQATYVQQVSLFARHFNRSPELLGPEQIRSYQVYLTNQRKLAPSSISIAIAALRFLYKITLRKDWSLEEVIPTPKTPQKLPIVLSQEQVLQFLGCVRNVKHRTTACVSPRLSASRSLISIVSEWLSESNRAKGGWIAMSCFPQSCCKSCVAGGQWRSPGSGSFPAIKPAATSVGTP